MDDTGSREGGAALCMESGVSAELLSAYNVSVRIEDPLLPPPGQGGALFADLVRIFQALSVVANNGPGSVGGGGVPRRPPPPPNCD